MNQISQTASIDSDRIDFLDLMVIVAESWKLIVIGTFLVAMATVVILFLTPPVYESSISLPLSSRVRATLNSPTILDPVIAANNLAAGGDADAARDSLWRKIRVEEPIKDSGIYRIGVQGDTPAQAKGLAASYLTQILLQSKPAGSEAENIQATIAISRDTVAELQKLSEHLPPGSSAQMTDASGRIKTEDDRFGGFSIPIEIAKRKAYIRGLERELDGLRIEDVLQQPNLPMKPLRQPRSSILLLATGAAFVALVIFAYLRDAFRRINEDPQKAKKLRRIRDALGWRRQNKVEST